VGVTPQGKVWIYSDPVSPISCVDQDGDDHLNEIMAKDGKCFISGKPGYLILNFGKLASTGFFKPSGKMDSGGGGGVDPPPKMPSKLAPIRSGSKGNIAHIEVKEQNGDWKEVARIYPRTTPVISLVELSPYVDPNQEFEMKISWDKSYSTDHIAYYRFDDTEITLTELTLSSAFHSEDGNVITALGSIDDQSVTLSPDQAIGVSFIAFPDNPPKKRDFLLVAKGYYEQLETLPQRDSPIPLRSGLPTIDQNYPNPFNVVTSIKFTLPDAARVTLNIYNILGQKVTTLVDEEKSSGTHTVFWDGRDKSGVEVASGIYFYQLKAGDYKELKKMLLIK
jgi:hypothetical protein